MMIVSRQAVLVFLSWCFLLVPTRRVLGSIFSFGSPSDNNHHDIISALLHRMKTLEAKVDRMETLQVQVAAELNQKVEIQQELIESLETLITTGSRMLNNFDEECYFTFFNETGTPTCLANYHLTAGKKKKKNSQMSSPPPLLLVVIFMLVIAFVVSPVYLVPPEHGLDVMGNATFDGGSTTFKNETSFVGKGEHVVSFSSDTGTTFYGPVVFDNRTTFERPARFKDNVEWHDKVKFYDDVTFGDSADVFFHDTVTFYDDVTIDGPGRYGKIRFTVKDRVDVEFKQRLDMTVNTETKFYKDVSIKQESCKGDSSNSGRGKGYGGCNYRPPIPDLYVDGDITGDSDLILKEGKVQVNKISPVGSSSYNKVVVDGELQVTSLESTTTIDADGTITGDAVIATGSGNSLRRRRRRRRAVSEEFDENEETKRTLQSSRTVITGNGIVTGGNINTTQNIYAKGNIEAGGAISPAFDPASLSRQTLQVAGLVATGTITGMTLVATNGTTRRRATESEDEVRRELQTTAPETTITADGIVATTISARENVRVGDGGIYTTGNINTTENVYATGNVVAGGSLSPAFDLTSLQGQTIEVAGLIATGSITLAASGARRRRRATETEETNDTRELQTTAETTITAEGIKTTGNITIESSTGGATTVLGSDGFDLSAQDVTVKSLVSTSSITASGAIFAGTTVTAGGNITSTGGSVSPVEVNDVMGLELDGFVAAEVLDAASLDTVTIQRLLQGADLELGGLTTTSFSTDDMNSTAVLTALEGVDLFVGSLTANTVSATTSLNAALDTGDIVSALVGSDLSVGSLTAEGNITSTNGLVSKVDVTDVIGLDLSGVAGSVVDTASVTADVLAAMASASVNVGSLTTSGAVSAGSISATSVSTTTFSGDSTSEALVAALEGSDLLVGSLTSEGNITSTNGLVSRVDVTDVVGLDLDDLTGSGVDTASVTANVLEAMASTDVNVGSLTTTGSISAGSVSTSSFTGDSTSEALVAALAGMDLSVLSLTADLDITSTNGLVSPVNVNDVIGLNLTTIVSPTLSMSDVVEVLRGASLEVETLTASSVNADTVTATTSLDAILDSRDILAALEGADVRVERLTASQEIVVTFEDDLGIVGTAFSVDSGGAFIRTSLAVGSDISIGSDLSVIGDAMISGDISANNFGGAVEDDQQ